MVRQFLEGGRIAIVHPAEGEHFLIPKNQDDAQISFCQGVPFYHLFQLTVKVAVGLAKEYSFHNSFWFQTDLPSEIIQIQRQENEQKGNAQEQSFYTYGDHKSSQEPQEKKGEHSGEDPMAFTLFDDLLLGKRLRVGV